jgi:hypothetical protein
LTVEQETLRDDDGTRLLFMDDIERLTGWTNWTVKHYATVARRARREGKETPKHMPAEVDKVRRTLVKSDDQPLVVNTPVWREDHIMAWLEARGVKLSGAA